jgi:hypothetical protein
MVKTPNAKNPDINKLNVKGLSEKAMLVSLVISQWLTRIVDQKITDEVALANSAKRDVGTYRKRLLANRGAVARVQVAVSSLRSYHSRMTLPWTKGVGILASSKYVEYSKGMRELISEFKEAARELLSAYPDLIEEAKEDLGDMWNAKDYPSPGWLERKFDIRLDVMPIPKAGDWRIDLSDEELEKLNEEIEKREKERVGQAMEELWERLYKPIKHMVAVLNKDNPRIFKTLITNISDLTAILPDLNLTDDSKLEDLRREVEDMLSDLSTDKLRDSTYLRNVAAETAEQLRQKIKDQGNIEDDEAMEMMSGYTGDKVIKKFGKMEEENDK